MKRFSKEIFFKENAIEGLVTGADKLANAVKCTLGPRGRNVILGRQFGDPVVTKDGVSVAMDVTLQNELEEAGARLIKAAASRTADGAGDGTTTATVLAQELIHLGRKSKANPQALRRGMELAQSDLDHILKQISTPLDREAGLLQVATISANDPEIGKVIAEAVEKVGEGGILTIEPGTTLGFTTDIVKGMRIPAGYVTPLLVTNPEARSAEYENVPVIVTDMKINTLHTILPLLEKMVERTQKRELVIIAEHFSQEVIGQFVSNKMKSIFSAVLIQAPLFGDRKRDLLQDVAAMVGATVISETAGMKFDQIPVSVIGSARKVRVTKEDTLIVDGHGSKERIAERISHAKEELEKADNLSAKEYLEERLAYLQGGVGSIRVCSASPVEQKEKMHRVEDAIAATKAALEEGILPGGGTALLRARREVERPDFLSAEELEGYNMVMDACEAPLRCILENAGVKDPEEVINQVDQGEGFAGFDAKNLNFVLDLKECGIIDPTKVTRLALLNAVSVAVMFLLTEVAIIDIPEDVNLPLNPRK